MPSHILAILFAGVMLVLTTLNRLDSSVNFPPAQQLSSSTLNEIEHKISPPFILSPSPNTDSISSPSPSILPSLSPPATSSRAEKENLPSLDIKARAFLLSDGDKIFLEKDKSIRLPIGSLAKLMSALVLVEEFPEDINIIISESAISLNQNRYNLSPGDIISKQEALDFILIPSSNIVAHSVAASLGENKFIQLMNRKAMNLGLNDTIFIDPSGISNFTSSTAQDIVKLLRYISENHPEILAISRTPQFEFKKGTSKASIVYNTNELLGTFPGIIGGKTGYTLEARGCLALVFEVGGRKFFAVVLGSSDRFGDMKKIIEYAKKI